MSESAQSKPTQSPTRPRGRPKVADVACLDAHLLSVGRELFFRHGYGAMTLSELAKIARVSKTTLYSRFPSKADLFRAIVMDQIRTWDTGPEHRPSESTTLLAALREYGDIVLRAGMTAEFIQMNRLLYS